MDLVDRDALIRQVQHTVVQVRIGVTLGAHDLLDAVITPARPGMGGEHHIRFLPEKVEGLVDLARPFQGIADEGAAQRVDVVNGGHDVLRGPEGQQVGEPRVHLRRSFRAGGVLEHHADAVDHELLDIGNDQPRGRDQPDRPCCDGLPDRLVDMAERAPVEQRSVLVERAPVHRVARVHVLCHRMVHEPDRGDHLHPSGLDVGFVDHAAHATEVVDVGVRVDHRNHGTRTEVLVDKGQCGSGCLLAGEGIEDDPPGVTLDEADVGQVETPYLVDLTGNHLEEAVTHVEGGLPLQGGVDAVVDFIVEQEIVSADIPRNVSGLRADLPIVRRHKEAVRRLLEVPRVLERQPVPQC